MKSYGHVPVGWKDFSLITNHVFSFTDWTNLMLKKFQWRFTRISTQFSSTAFPCCLGRQNISNIKYFLACSVQCEGLKTQVCSWGSLACCKSQHHPGPEHHLHASTCHQIIPSKDKIFFTFRSGQLTWLTNHLTNYILYKPNWESLFYSNIAFNCTLVVFKLGWALKLLIQNDFVSVSERQSTISIGHQLEVIDVGSG